jgi:hypothetical protein
MAEGLWLMAMAHGPETIDHCHQPLALSHDVLLFLQLLDDRLGLRGFL